MIHDNPVDPEAYFDDYDSASAAVTTAEAAELFTSTRELATGGGRILFSDAAPS